MAADASPSTAEWRSNGLTTLVFFSNNSVASPDRGAFRTGTGGRQRQDLAARRHAGSRSYRMTWGDSSTMQRFDGYQSAALSPSSWSSFSGNEGLSSSISLSIESSIGASLMLLKYH